MPPITDTGGPALNLAADVSGRPTPLSTWSNATQNTTQARKGDFDLQITPVSLDSEPEEFSFDSMMLMSPKAGILPDASCCTISIESAASDGAIAELQTLLDKTYTCLLKPAVYSLYNILGLIEQCLELIPKYFSNKPIIDNTDTSPITYMLASACIQLLYHAVACCAMLKNYHLLNPLVMESHSINVGGFQVTDSEASQKVVDALIAMQSTKCKTMAHSIEGKLGSIKIDVRAQHHLEACVGSVLAGIELVSHQENQS